MTELAAEEHLAPEARHGGGVAASLRAQGLERHGDAELLVERRVDLTDRAARDEVQDPVSLGDLLARREAVTVLSLSAPNRSGAAVTAKVSSSSRSGNRSRSRAGKRSGGSARPHRSDSAGNLIERAWPAWPPGRDRRSGLSFRPGPLLRVSSRQGHRGRSHFRCNAQDLRRQT